ncbi:hypothetical protein G5T42_05395 [Microbacterium sp. 4R-513]|uniref:hypothetical protein n=1 Tax=Microbacterium sp. 4R-513 TaxID=2567934 RepID=UPI0013E19CF0|nr:hypothetical protein [Microbacterium sp. 4R-513]QIG38993.1 hypothetical protein G5T42_05395 [Microbacterium sp. 4R-513]
MTLDAASVPFDARPLTEPVDRATVRNYAARLRAARPAGSGFGAASSIIAVVVVVFVVVVFGGAFLTMFVSIFASIAASGGASAPGTALIAVAPLVIVAIVTALAIIGIVASLRLRDERWYRLGRFAQANRMTYLPTIGSPALPGMIFGIGSGREATDVVRGERPRFVEFANYRYTTGSGKNKTTHRWGYVAVKLDVPLPNIVLDATGNNSLLGTNLPASFDRAQRLRLEGDFDEHFALYCPEGYERDALYLFTPDIMARFIDNAAALDVEIVDDWLFFYGRRDFSTLDPATWAWLFSVVGALLDKLTQWARWRDERLQAQVTPWVTDASTAGAAASLPSADPASTDAVAAPGATPFAAPAGMLRPPPGVAPQGRRLNRRVSWVTIVAMVVIIGMWLLSQTGLWGLIFR